MRITIEWSIAWRCLFSRSKCATKDSYRAEIRFTLRYFRAPIEEVFENTLCLVIG